MSSRNPQNLQSNKQSDKKPSKQPNARAESRPESQNDVSDVIADNVEVNHGSDAYAALRIPSFRNYILVRFLITIAVQIQGVAVAWKIYDVTEDPLALGFIGLAEAIPAITVALYAGHVADVRSRKTIALWALSVLAACSLALCAWSFFQPQIAPQMLPFPASPAVMTQLRVLDVRWIYAVIFVSGIARGFLAPATAGIVAQLVPSHLYSNSSAWSSSTWQTASVFGPALGGLIYGFAESWRKGAGAEVTFGVDAVLMIGALLAMAWVPRTPIPPRHDELSIGQSVREGLRFVFSNQVVLAAITLDLFAVLFGGAIALLPVFAKDILFADERTLGFLRAAPAAGAALMGLWLAHNPIRENAGQRLFIAVAAFGVCIIGFALSRSVWVSFALLALSGAFDNISVVIRITLLQLQTPDAMRGRVSSVNSIFIGSSNEIGAFQSGLFARLMGPVESVVWGGFVTMWVVAATARYAPKLRKMKDITK